jgi:hypothetical protein
MRSLIGSSALECNPIPDPLHPRPPLRIVPEKAGRPGAGEMRVVQIAALAACAVLLAGCGGTHQYSTVDWLLGRVPAYLPDPKPLSGILDLNSEPRGAEVKTSLGASCRTPCSLEVTAEAPFTVTFSHEGYVSSTVNVKIQPGEQGVSDPKFTPNPVVGQLAAAPNPQPSKPAPRKPPARQ